MRHAEVDRKFWVIIGLAVLALAVFIFIGTVFFGGAQSSDVPPTPTAPPPTPTSTPDPDLVVAQEIEQSLLRIEYLYSNVCSEFVVGAAGTFYGEAKKKEAEAAYRAAYDGLEYEALMEMYRTLRDELAEIVERMGSLCLSTYPDSSAYLDGLAWGYCEALRTGDAELAGALKDEMLLADGGDPGVRGLDLLRTRFVHPHATMNAEDLREGAHLPVLEQTYNARVKARCERWREERV